MPTDSQAYPPKGVFGSLGRDGRCLKKIRKAEVERIQGFGGLFSKSNPCCYNTLNIKNILIINIHLPLSTKTLVKKR